MKLLNRIIVFDRDELFNKLIKDNKYIKQLAFLIFSADKNRFMIHYESILYTLLEGVKDELEYFILLRVFLLRFEQVTNSPSAMQELWPSIIHRVINIFNSSSIPHIEACIRTLRAMELLEVEDYMLFEWEQLIDTSIVNNESLNKDFNQIKALYKLKKNKKVIELIEDQVMLDFII